MTSAKADCYNRLAVSFFMLILLVRKAMSYAGICHREGVLQATNFFKITFKSKVLCFKTRSPNFSSRGRM